MTTNFYEKYLKYKNKYLQLKQESTNQNQLVGGTNFDNKINKLIEDNKELILKIYNLYQKKEHKIKKQRGNYNNVRSIDIATFKYFIASQLLTFEYWNKEESKYKRIGDLQYWEINLCDHPVVKSSVGDTTYITLNTNSSYYIRDKIKKSITSYNSNDKNAEKITDADKEQFAEIAVEFRNFLIVSELNNYINNKTTQKIIINLQESDRRLKAKLDSTEFINANGQTERKISNFVPQNLDTFSVKIISTNPEKSDNNDLLTTFRSETYDSSHFINYVKDEEHGFITICCGFLTENRLTAIPLIVTSKLSCWDKDKTDTILAISCRATFIKELNIVNAHLDKDYAIEQFYQLIYCGEPIVFRKTEDINLTTGLVNLSKINTEYSIGNFFKSKIASVITDKEELEKECVKINSKVKIFIDSIGIVAKYNGSNIEPYECDKLVITGDFNISIGDRSKKEGILNTNNDLKDDTIIIDESKRKKYRYWYKHLDFIVIPEVAQRAVIEVASKVDKQSDKLVVSSNTQAVPPIQLITQQPKESEWVTTTKKQKKSIIPTKTIQTIQTIQTIKSTKSETLKKIKSNYLRDDKCYGLKIKTDSLDLEWKVTKKGDTTKYPNKRFNLKSDMEVSFNGKYDNITYYKDGFFYQYNLTQGNTLWDKIFEFIDCLK